MSCLLTRYPPSVGRAAKDTWFNSPSGDRTNLRAAPNWEAKRVVYHGPDNGAELGETRATRYGSISSCETTAIEKCVDL